MLTSRKLKAFEYLIFKLNDWHKEVNQFVDNNNNDFSKLKLIKLLFFVSAVEASEEKSGLLSVFDNYWAMPFGHVESDIYNNIHELNLFEVSKTGTKMKEEPASNYFEDINDIKDLLDKSIYRLREINSSIIKYSAFDLVEISHMWHSWQTIFNLAKQQNKLSLKIPTHMIQLEPKIFHLEIEV